MVASKLKRSENEGDANQPPVAVLNVEVTIPVKYLSNTVSKAVNLWWWKDVVKIALSCDPAIFNFLWLH